jgi:O-antigen/teichoic acid export membrane protein
MSIASPSGSISAASLTGRQRLLREGAWVMLGQVASGLALLVGARLTTEFIPPKDYGTANLLLGLSVLAQDIFCTPILHAALRFYPDRLRCGDVWRLRQITRTYLLKTTVPLLLLMVLGGAVYSHFTALSFWAFPLLAGLVAFLVPQTLELNFWMAARRQRPAALINGGVFWLRPLLIVAGAWWLGPSPQVVVLGYMLASAIVYVIGRLVVPREGLLPPPHAVPDPQFDRSILRYAAPLMPLAIVAWITALSDRYIVGGLLNAEAVGVYSIAYSLISHPFLIGYGTLSRTLTPVYFQAVSHENHRSARRVFLAWLGATVLMGLVGLVLVLLLKHWIVQVLLAERYRASVELLPWIAGGYCLYSVGWVFEKRLHAQKQTLRLLCIHSAVAATAIAAPLVLMRHFGLRGVAMACPIYFGLMALLMILFSAPPPGLKPDAGDVAGGES